MSSRRPNIAIGSFGALPRGEFADRPTSQISPPPLQKFRPSPSICYDRLIFFRLTPCADWVILESATRSPSPFRTRTRGFFGAKLFICAYGDAPSPSSLSFRCMGGSITCRRFGRGELACPVCTWLPNRGGFIATLPPRSAFAYEKIPAAQRIATIDFPIAKDIAPYNSSVIKADVRRPSL